jgi:hypothetical protein
MLARAYALRRAAPMVTAVCLPVTLIVSLALAWTGALRPSPSRRHRVLRVAFPVLRGLSLAVLVGLTSLVTWFSRQNHFEWMFAQPAEVKYVSAAEATKFLTPDEMVMGVEVSGLSLAYPVRQMAYHHVVNDILGTTPVVVTY